METKYLDVHIIYSDKDKKYLPKLLQQYKKFKIENSIYNWELLLKVHNNSGINNIGQFQRRLEIIKDAPEDHYIWFVDGDDEIIENANLKNCPENDIDMYIFAYKGFAQLPSKKVITVDEKYLFKDTFFNKEKGDYFFEGPRGMSNLTHIGGGALWNKWIRVKCWHNLFNYLKNMNYENIRPNSSEDCFYSLYALNNANYIFYSITPIYQYRNDRSLVFNPTNNIIKYQSFLNFRKNHKEVTEAIRGLNIPYIEDFFIADRCCHLEKALLCVEIKKALQDVVDEFGKETIINVLENYGDRVNSCHPTVKHLAYKYLTK